MSSPLGDGEIFGSHPAPIGRIWNGRAPKKACFSNITRRGYVRTPSTKRVSKRLFVSFVYFVVPRLFPLHRFRGKGSSVQNSRGACGASPYRQVRDCPTLKRSWFS